jgi:hypothetical protein
MRRLLSVCGYLMLLGCVGCTMCASPFDCQYVAYGGVRERTDMIHGRVGSRFDPAPEINHVRPEQQSPTPAGPQEPAAAAPESDGEPGAARPPETLPSPPPGTSPIRPGEATPDAELPDVPEGTLELPNGDSPLDALPEMPLDAAPESDSLESLPDDSDDRSAQRDPWQDVFDDEL